MPPVGEAWATMECNRDSARRLIRLLVHCCCGRWVPVLPCGSWLLRDCLVKLLGVAELCELGCTPDMARPLYRHAICSVDGGTQGWDVLLGSQSGYDVDQLGSARLERYAQYTLLLSLRCKST